MKYEFKKWDIQPGDLVLIDCSHDNSHDTAPEMEAFNGYWLEISNQKGSYYYSTYPKFSCHLQKKDVIRSLPSRNGTLAYNIYPDRWTWASQQFAAVSRDGKIIYDDRLKEQERFIQLKTSQLPDF